jgi:hypothetical protein
MIAIFMKASGAAVGPSSYFKPKAFSRQGLALSVARMQRSATPTYYPSWPALNNKPGHDELMGRRLG